MLILITAFIQTLLLIFIVLFFHFLAYCEIACIFSCNRVLHMDWIFWELQTVLVIFPYIFVVENTYLLPTPLITYVHVEFWFIPFEKVKKKYSRFQNVSTFYNHHKNEGKNFLTPKTKTQCNSSLKFTPIHKEHPVILLNVILHPIYFKAE